MPHSCFCVNFAQSWSPATIRSAEWQDALSPQVDFNSHGNAQAVWYRYDNEFPRIQFAQYTALTNRWTAINNVLTISAANSASMEPQITIDTVGNTIAMWTTGDINLKNKRIQSSRYTASSNQWTPISAQPFLSEEGMESSGPQIALDGAGNAMAVWQVVDDSGTWTVQAAYYDASAHDWVRDGMNQPLLKNLSTGITSTGGTLYFPTPKIAMDNNGNALIVWQKRDNSIYRVETTRYTGSDWTTWDPTNYREYLSTSALDTYWPNIAIDPSGNATVIWELFEEDPPGSFFLTIQAARYDISIHDWIRNDFAQTVVISIETYSTSSYSEFSTANIAMDHKGNAIIVWYKFDSFFKILATRYDKLHDLWSSWSPTLEEISEQNKSSVLPEIAMDPPGNAIVAWQSFDGNGNWRTQVSKYDTTNNTWQSTNDLPILSPEGNDATQHTVVMDRNGNAIVMWGQSDGINQRIIESHYERVPRPTNLRASRLLNRFPTQADLTNEIRWDGNNSTIVRYELYTDANLTQLVGSVSSNKPYIFNHHCRKPCTQNTYYIVAVDNTGIRSNPAYITVP